MRKLTLEMDSLQVESFDTVGETGRRGTVLGNDTVETEWCTGYPECISRKCDTPNDTCYGSCGCTHKCGQGTHNCS